MQVVCAIHTLYIHVDISYARERGRYNGLGYLYMQITTIEVPNKNETRVFIIHTYCPKQKKERFKEKKYVYIYNQKVLYAQNHKK